MKLKVHEERSIEEAALMNSLKCANIELDRLKKELQSKHKFFKEKEKKVNKLEMKVDKIADSLDKSKSEVKLLKSDNSKLLKKQRKVQLKRSQSVSTNTSPSEEFPIPPSSTISLSTNLSSPPSIYTSQLVPLSSTHCIESNIISRDLLNNEQPFTTSSEASSASLSHSSNTLTCYPTVNLKPSDHSTINIKTYAMDNKSTSLAMTISKSPTLKSNIVTANKFEVLDTLKLEDDGKANDAEEEENPGSVKDIFNEFRKAMEKTQTILFETLLRQQQQEIEDWMTRKIDEEES